jgi:hypothetical protein
MWAEYPSITIWYVATEAIYIIIFALFYLLSLNFDPDRIINFFVNLVPPAIIVWLITYIIDPDAIRAGGYSLRLLPFILLFCTLKLIQSFSLRNVVFITTCLLMLVAGMSRTPLLIAGLGLFLAFIIITKGAGSRRKLAAAFVIIGVVATIAILAVQPLKIYAAKTIARSVYQDVAVGDEVFESEKIDIVRWGVMGSAFSLYDTNWLFGMGYMNFMPWFGSEHNYIEYNVRGKEVVGVNLHNTFQTWALEGGLPCVGIVVLLLWKYFSILRRRIRQSKNDLDKSYYKLFVILMVCLLVQGMFHQIHQMPVLFMFLGIVYALGNKQRYGKIGALPEPGL